MVDLHTHSTVSDGSDPPERIPELARAAGCRAVALTDHDSLDGLPAAARRGGELGVVVVGGCEVSCAFSPGTMHVLVYFVDQGSEPLASQLASLRADREQRNAAMLARLSELGIHIGEEELRAEAGGGSVGRPHVAALLVRKGVARDLEDAFDRFLAKGRPAYVPKARLDPAAVARLAAASNGVAVLAHPLSLALKPAALERLVGELAEAGFGGLEAIYGRYGPDEREALCALARRCDLVATGGSDYHGTYKPDLALGTGRGDLEVPDEALEALSARRPKA